MRNDLKDKSVLVYDYFNYVEVAIRLSRDFGTVYYYCPYVLDSYPDHIPEDIARNVPGIIKVKEWASVVMEVDMVYFTYSHEPYLQDFIRNVLVKPVFGSVFANRLEHDRSFIKETLKQLGLPVGLYSEAKGLDQLEEILKNSNGKRYVKSSLRGDMETWEHKDWRLSQREIKRLRHDMGLFEDEETYIIEHPIDGIGEIGYDGFFVNGKYTDISLCGIEIKNCCYIGRFIYYKMLPQQITSVNDALSPLFNDMGYRGHYSNEIIISKDKRGFLIDNTCRCPQPPTSLMLEAYKGYSENVWDIAHGRMPYIEYDFEWGCQLMIKSIISEDMPSPILVPDEYKQFVKISNLSIDKEGTWWYIPSETKNNDIGSVIGLGHTMDEAIKKAKEVAESIQGFDTTIKIDSIDKAKKSLDKLNKAGIPFI